MLRNKVWVAEAQAQKERFIPESMKQKNQWVCWRLDGRKKLPFNARTGTMASSTDQSTWSDYQTAQDAAEKYGYSGVGIVLNGDGLICIDLDDSDDENGNPKPLTKNICGNFWDTYIEQSQSNKGRHIFCFGQIPKSVKTKSVEIYNTGRFICVTGKSITPCEVKNKQEQLNTLWSWLDKQRNGNKPQREERPQVDYQCSMSAQEIIDRATNAKGGDVFADLYAGNWQGLNIGDCSQSAADLSFANRLYFWCGGDSALMTEIFKNSGMHRNERKTRLAISKAIADCGEIYKGRR
jgi:primase-polymerase (primpol)-like protein